MLTPDAALQDAQRIWTEIAPELGLNPAAYSASIARARLKEKNSRIVVRLEGDGVPSLILKHGLSNGHVNHFRNGVDAHRKAMDVFEGHPDLHVPQLLYADDARQVTVMTHAPGYTAHDAFGLAVTASDRAYVLQSCGAWLGHLHQATFVKENKISPNAMKKFVVSQRDRVDAGQLQVPNPDLFLQCSDRALEIAEAARGKTTRLASTHGDMNLRNFILGPEGTFGLDFGAIHNAPIGHDLARFFVNFANFYFPDDANSQDPTWLAQDHHSFFSGYGEAYQDDPSFYYLMRTQVLKDWSTIPKNPAKRNSLHKRRWRGLKLLVELLF